MYVDLYFYFMFLLVFILISIFIYGLPPLPPTHRGIVRLGSGRVVGGSGPVLDESEQLWGGSGVGAERRSELQFAECLEDSGSGGQILRNVSRIVAPGGSRFRAAWRSCDCGWVR